jgi:hypothetical protein
LDKYIDALKTLKFELIQEAAIKEASRQVGEMSRWLKWKPEHNPEEFEVFSYLVDPIKKAETYRFNIYNRTKKLKPIDAEIAGLVKLQVEGEPFDLERLIALRDEKAKSETEQYTLAIRILKIYCYVQSQTVLVKPKEEKDHFAEREDVYKETE